VCTIQTRTYSQVGQGTTICLYLARHLGKAKDSESGEVILSSDPGNGESVLVVDDESTIRMLVCDLLVENGYIPLEAPDGPTALKFLQSNLRIDLLVTDVGYRAV
jgi:PleD family two-component response regulator